MLRRAPVFCFTIGKWPAFLKLSDGSATPQYRNPFASAIAASIARAEKEIADPARDPNLDACTVLGPVLELMYAGRFDEGVALFRRLYRRADASELERKTIEKVRTRPFWVP